MSSPIHDEAELASAESAARAAAWDTMYDKLVQFHQKHGHCRIPYRDKSLRTLYMWVCRQRNPNSAPSQQCRARLDALGFDWASQHNQNRKRRWDEMFRRLEAYKDKYKNFFVLVGYGDEDRHLVEWVKKQCFDYRQEKMPEERVQRLESLGFDWDPGAYSVDDEGSGRRRGSPPAGEDTSWEVLYEKVARHYRTNGNCHVSKSRSADLYDWILEQRVANANSALSADKRRKLDQIRFSWMSEDKKHDDIWNKMFESLKAYKAANGDCLVSRSYCEDPKLYDWVVRQRGLNKTGKLPMRRRDRLQGMGFCWESSGASGDTSQSQRRAPAPVAPAGGRTSWDVMYEKLARYYGTNGNCRVSKSTRADLHNWILEQRVANANNELPADKRLKLDQIHFAWTGKDEKHEELWNKMFENFEAYKAANGDRLVPGSCQEDPKLYNWVKTQRHAKKKGKLVRHRRDRLEGIGFCWGVNSKPKVTKQAPNLDGLETISGGAPTSVSLPSSVGQQVPPPRWNLQLERLKIYQAWHGDCLVPTSYDKELAEWVSWQHHLNNNNKLGEPRYGKLERMGFFLDAKAE